MADTTPIQPQNQRLAFPPGYKPFTGTDNSNANIYFSDLQAQFKLQPQIQTPVDLRVTYASQLLDGAAKKWYVNVFAQQPEADQTFAKFKEQLRARFARGDENIVSRRQQQALRVVPHEPRNMIASVNEFNSNYSELQGNITGQGTQDAVLQYMECIRQSIPSYPDVLQLQQRVSQTLLALEEAKRTLPKAQELAAVTAPDIIDTPAPAGRLVTAHNMVTLQPMQQVSSSYGPMRRRPLNERQRQVQYARQHGFCTYCCDPHADHKTVRSVNPATQQYTGEIICQKLKQDIADGKAEDRSQRFNNRSRNNNYNNSQQQQPLNSSGSRTVTYPAAQRT